MNLDQAFDLTGTKNKNQLAKKLSLSPTAVYKWPEVGEIPDSGAYRVLKSAGLTPGHSAEKTAKENS